WRLPPAARAAFVRPPPSLGGTGARGGTPFPRASRALRGRRSHHGSRRPPVVPAPLHGAPRPRRSYDSALLPRAAREGVGRRAARTARRDGDDARPAAGDDRAA